MKRFMAIFLFSFSTLSVASCCGEPSYGYVDAAFGLAFYPNLTTTGSQTSVGRLNLGVNVFTQEYWQLGFEAGVQSGNAMRLAFPKEQIDWLGGVPLEVKFKPMLDVLGRINIELFENIPCFLWLKGGVAYQHLYLDRDSVNEIKGFSPEAIVGLGYMISEQAAVHVGYQYVWGRDSELSVNSLSETAVLKNIPSHQAVMLGFSFSFI